MVGELLLLHNAKHALGNTLRLQANEAEMLQHLSTSNCCISSDHFSTTSGLDKSTI